MTRPLEPIDHSGAGGATQDVERQLERYTSAASGVPATDFVDRVMSGVEQLPVPRRGLVAGLLLVPGSWR